MSHLSAPNATQAAISVIFWMVPVGLEAPGAWVNTAPALAAAPPTTAAALSSRFFFLPPNSRDSWINRWGEETC